MLCNEILKEYFCFLQFFGLECTHCSTNVMSSKNNISFVDFGVDEMKETVYIIKMIVVFGWCLIYAHFACWWNFYFAQCNIVNHFCLVFRRWRVFSFSNFTHPIGIFYGLAHLLIPIENCQQNVCNSIQNFQSLLQCVTRWTTLSTKEWAPCFDKTFISTGSAITKNKPSPLVFSWYVYVHAFVAVHPEVLLQNFISQRKLMIYLEIKRNKEIRGLVWVKNWMTSSRCKHCCTLQINI